MARRTTKSPTRIERRREVEAAEKIEKVADATGKVAKPKAVKKTVRRKSTKKKVDATRLRLVWGVFDNSNQQVATFPYQQRSMADTKATEMTAKGRGPYFVQPVKEPMPIEDVPEPEKKKK